MTRPTLLGNRTRAGYDMEMVDDLIAELVERGELFEYEDRDGHTRYALATRDGLLAVIQEQAARDAPNQELIGRCNKRLQEVGDG